jgi:serine/threonine protein kinase
MDIKPENIFLKASGTFKIGDFGLALRQPVVGAWEEGDGRYVAPELLVRSHAPTGAADVYSLGATIVHCASGTISHFIYVPQAFVWHSTHHLQPHAHAGNTLASGRSPASAAKQLAGLGYSLQLQQVVASMLAAQASQRPSACTLTQITEEHARAIHCEVCLHPRFPFTRKPMYIQDDEMPFCA